MAFQFPLAPSNGQIFNAAPGLQYTWNGTGWAPTGSALATPIPLFPDGTVAAPGITWLNDSDTGWSRQTKQVTASLDNVLNHVWSDTGFHVQPGIAFKVFGTSDFVGAVAATSTITATGGLYANGGIAASGITSSGVLQVNGQAKFSNGSAASPSIAFTNDLTTGFAKIGSELHACVNGASVLHCAYTGLYVPPYMSFWVNGGKAQFSGPLVAAGPMTLPTDVSGEHVVSTFRQLVWRVGTYTAAVMEVIPVDYTPATLRAVLRFNIARSAQATGDDFEMTFNGFTLPQFKVHGWSVTNIAGIVDLPIKIHGVQDGGSGVCMVAGTSVWGMTTNGVNLSFGNSVGTGPAAMSYFSMQIDRNGSIWARAFGQLTFAATNVTPMTGALSDILKLRGVRCFNTETQRPDIRVELDDIERAFPELVSEVGEGKGIDYTLLAAPIIEAIRELAAQHGALELSIAALASRVKATERLLTERRR